MPVYRQKIFMKITSIHSITAKFILIAMVTFASGCASSSVRAPGQVAAYKATPQQPIRSVSVTLNPGVNNSIKFDIERMERAIEIALKNERLYDASASLTSPELNVEVTKIRIRSSFNAMAWGVMAGNDSIQGNVIIRDSSGRILDQFLVKTSYALGGLAGQDGVRIDWLYEAFAEEIVDQFTK